ncbi:MAG: hypothetical protein AAB706_00910 [Patescibacteria group bacterium]
MSEIILNKQNQKEDLSRRIEEFKVGFKELSIKTQLNPKPQITPDGPVLSLIDVKYVSKVQKENNQVAT